MQAEELIDIGMACVSVAGLIGILLLVPLYLSQRRDVRRLRAWMERVPGHPEADLAASEAMLDRAERELEELLGETVVQPAPPAAEPERPSAPTPTPTVPLPAAQRVTGERPALERVTMEREALIPYPRWRRFAARATRPRVLVAVAIAAVLLGAAAIFGSERLLTAGDGGDRGGRSSPGQVEVAVLNGTTAGGLAGKVGSDLQANGFELGRIANAEPGHDQTVVMFAPGRERQARRVARTLGVRAVQPLDRQTRRLAGGAEVVVIAGEDRARP